MKSTESTCRNPECGKLYFKFKTTDKYCSFECSRKCEKPPNLKLTPISKPITPKCKVCREKFTPKRQSTEPTCDNYDCKVQYATEYAKKLGLQKAKDLKAKNFKEKTELREKLKTLGDWKKELQTEINSLIRAIDHGHLCISDRSQLNSKFDAGHMYSRGSNPSLSFNLMNIYGQSVHSNQYKSGDQIKFLEGLEIDFGTEHKDYVLSLKKLYPILKITIEDIKPKIPLVRNLIKFVKKQEKKFTNEERIFLRKQFNEAIGIYK